MNGHDYLPAKIVFGVEILDKAAPYINTGLASEIVHFTGAIAAVLLQSLNCSHHRSEHLL